MNTARVPSSGELALITTLMHQGSVDDKRADPLADLRVKPMCDGGMGSLLLLPHGCSESERAFGEVIASCEFIDTDGVPVSVTLNLDQQGQLFELDVWKADFSPLHAWPDPLAIRLASR